MPHITTPDGTRLYYEEVGAGSPVVFVHEYAGDYRTWEPQLRYFARAHRCITLSQRGYPPSDVPDDPKRYTETGEVPIVGICYCFSLLCRIGAAATFCALGSFRNLRRC